MSQKPDFLHGQRFAGFYIDLLDIRFLRGLQASRGSHNLEHRWADLTDRLDLLTRYIICLKMSDAVLWEVESGALSAGAAEEVRDLIESIFSHLSIGQTGSIARLRDRLAEETVRIQNGQTDPLIFDDSSLPAPKSAPNPDQFAERIRTAIDRHSLEDRPAVVFLLDHYESLDMMTQRLMNNMLLRNNLFRTKVAARYFGLQTLETGTSRLVPGDDFELVPIEYLDSEWGPWTEHLKEVTSILLEDPSEGLIVAILDHALASTSEELSQAALDYNLKSSVKPGATIPFVGFLEFCRLAGGSVRTFIRLCRESVWETKGVAWRKGIPVRAQLAAANFVALREFERLSEASGVPSGQLAKLVEMLGKVVSAPER